MAGTRTAPDVTGTPTGLHLSVSFIDNSGDTWSESHIIPATSTGAQREAYLDALQAATSASIYKVKMVTDFGTDALADSDNADPVGAKSTSVFDGLNITVKHSTDLEKKDKILRIPAPLTALFVNDGDYVSDVLDGASEELAAVMGAFLTMLGAGWAIAWGRYTERQETNEKTRI